MAEHGGARGAWGILAAAALLAWAAAPVAGQAPGHSTGDWKRVETENFLFLYPEELAGWALPMAERMEAVRDAVQALVGFAPEDRVTVLVDDPSNVSNGSMSPGPILFMWPTPPNPRSMIACSMLTSRLSRTSPSACRCSTDEEKAA